MLISTIGYIYIKEMTKSLLMHMALKLWSCLHYKSRLTDITCLVATISHVSLKVPWIAAAPHLHIDRLSSLFAGSQNMPSEQLGFHHLAKEIT